ncbi:MAG: hypothetical protein R3343_13675 [Nitriliruptorales bacterium]|nr:hypothetical protein [Nitriliruptorales bacterium]
MSVDVHEPASDRTEPTDADRHRRWAYVLLATAAWNVWLWVTRVWNLINDPEPRTTEFIVVHAALYVVSFGLAIAVGVIGWRLLKGSRGQRP